MTRPTDEQFQIARLWLESNEGEGDELEACKSVANWIGAQMQERMLRQEARRAGVTYAALRKRLEATP